MAAELVTPVDVISGLPLPIVPEEDVYLPMFGTDETDFHHAYHPASHPELKTTVGGAALRNSRLQLVNKDFHNRSQRSYHRFYKGPEIPTDPDEQFRLCVLASAGYVPDYGIDLRSGEPEVVELTAAQKEQLSAIDPDDTFQRREVKYRYEPIRAFFSEFALRQDITHVRSSIIEEFLHTGQIDRQKYLGHLLIAQAAEAAGETVAEEYEEVRQAGMLNPRAPRHPSTLIKYKIGNSARRERLIPKLRDRLSTVFDSGVAGDMESLEDDRQFVDEMGTGGFGPGFVRV